MNTTLESTPQKRNISEEDILVLDSLGVSSSKLPLLRSLFTDFGFEDRIVIPMNLQLPPYCMIHNVGFPIVQLYKIKGKDVLTCRIEWGRRSNRIQLVSSPCEDFETALKQVCDEAKLIRPEHEIPTKYWRDLLVGYVGPGIPVASFKFTNRVPVGRPRYKCTLCNQTIIESDPHDSMHSAIEDLASKIRAKDLASKIRALLPVAHKSPPSPLQAERPTNAPPQLGATSKNKRPRVSIEDQRNELSKLLKVADDRWRAEHRYLMALPRRNDVDEARISKISHFLAVRDPLRRYEIDRGQAVFLLNEMFDEITSIAKELTPEGVHMATVYHLQFLLGQAVAEGGHPVVKLPEFRHMMQRKGIDPSRVINRFVRKRFLRRGMDGTLTLTPIGAQLLATDLERTCHADTLGAALQPNILADLANLKFALSR